MPRSAARFLPLVVGLSILAIGLAGVVLYYTTPKQPEISGDQVIELSQCSQGYAEGYCPVASLDWSGSLVSPSSVASPNTIEIWGLQGADPDTCGLPATYTSNIPVGTSGAQGGSQVAPLYEPLGQAIKGVFIYGSTVFFYTTDTYTLADGCSGQNLASSTVAPVQGTITYLQSGSQTTTLGTSATYNFASLNPLMALIVAGGFLGSFGFFLASDKFVGP